MKPHNRVLDRRKPRPTRRRPDKPPISAHLLLDDRIKGDVGILSPDLLDDLFPRFAKAGGDPARPLPTLHVAVAPWQPTSLLSAQASAWTILAVQPPPPQGHADPSRPHSSIQFPASSAALQSFVRNWQAVSPGKSLPRRDAPVEIRILDAVPLGLDTVYVTLDTEQLRRYDETQAQFRGGFGAASTKDMLLTPMQLKSRPGPEERRSQEGRWRQAIRDALKTPKLVHSGDMLALPLPTHPITHAPAPPAKITACEPVTQGILTATSRIVVLYSGKSRDSKPVVVQAPVSNGIPEEDEDTSNEAFYSAAEERGTSASASAPDDETTDDLRSETSATDQDDLSDDSEDVFSLASPGLPPATGVMSSWQSATPRPGLHPYQGIGTPGSLRSGISTSTHRHGGSTKLFKAQGLLQKLPEDILHPKPGPDEDEEARVYVDTSMLVKIGCFSGDWVRLEAAEEPSSHGLVPWNFAGFYDEDEDAHDWRAAKVYGLPELASRRHARMAAHKGTSGRKSSFLEMMTRSMSANATAFASPILLANLGTPTHLRIAPLGLGMPQKVSSSAAPPNAKEVTLMKLSTPLASDRMLQPSLFTSLKLYFERRQRIVRNGDLIAITIDEALGRSVFSGSDDPAEDEILSKSKAAMGLKSDKSKAKVAWFRIDSISRTPSEDDPENNVWGNIVAMDASNVKMVQAGSEQGRALSTRDSSWQYYLGVRRTPVAAPGTVDCLPATTTLPNPPVPAIRRRLRELMSAGTSPQAIHLKLPPTAVLLTSTQRQIGKAYNAERACEDLGLHCFTIDAWDVVSESGAGGSDVKTEGVLRARADRALSCGAEYTAILIKHIGALSAERMTTAFKEILGDSRVIIATTTEVDKIPDGIRGSFTHELEMTAPDEGEREAILRSIVDNTGVRLAPDVELSSVAVKTAALVAGDLLDVVDRALVAKQTRLQKLSSTFNALHNPALPLTIRDIELAGGPAASCLIKADLDVAVEAARKNFADSIGAPKIPNVTWDDVGGLTHVKEAVMETIQLPLSRPELFAKGMKKRSGILFYGPPGTGKTLLAKAIATEFSLNFFSVKGPELLNMYIGESEANVRRVFQRARDARPCVVFFDELDSVAPKRGNQGDSGGVMDRIVSQLLAELDGMSDGEEGGGGVFVIGATNRPDLLDQALLRPGRFDKMLYLGISDTHEKQRTILEALTRKFTLDPSLSLHRIAHSLPFTYTGADLYALCSDAMLKAITRQASLIDQKVAAHNKTLLPGAPPLTIAAFFDHHTTDEDTSVVVTEEDFAAAKRELVPSVSYEELGHYERVRATFEGAGTAKNDAVSVAVSAAPNVARREEKSMALTEGVEALSIAPQPASGGAGSNGHGFLSSISGGMNGEAAAKDQGRPRERDKEKEAGKPPSSSSSSSSRRLSAGAAKILGFRDKTLSSLSRRGSLSSRHGKAAIAPSPAPAPPPSAHAVRPGREEHEHEHDDDNEEEEDEYLIETGHLAASSSSSPGHHPNGNANGHGNGNGNGNANGNGAANGSAAGAYSLSAGADGHVPAAKGKARARRQSATRRGKGSLSSLSTVVGAGGAGGGGAGFGDPAGEDEDLYS